MDDTSFYVYFYKNRASEYISHIAQNKNIQNPLLQQDKQTPI